jgi:hypothetical protein
MAGLSPVRQPRTIENANTASQRMRTRDMVSVLVDQNGVSTASMSEVAIWSTPRSPSRWLLA